ncbi:WD repeat-containing protein 27 [Nematolebias whitei]|uniref:WD repeat-containing protein 27 n=1 Tax=Nematolebias whitei TaxID=451745 RepID=UPI00189805FF|nr:WD repeat-containing protein 27 [Nematolebias whitei]
MITQKLSLTCDRLLSHQQLACCHSYCGIPFNGKEVLIYSVGSQQKPLPLTGHHGDISAMTFGKRSRPVLLCSASADYIIVWDIETCQRKIQEGEVATGVVIGALLGDIVHLTFCVSDERVAACSGSNIYILTTTRQEVICTLTGHLGPLTSAEFCPWNRNILVSTSEDRTFKVWDLKTEAVFYQSFVLSASPLLSVLFLEKDGHLITGSADGQVWCFSLGDGIKCHLVKKMDLLKMERRHQGRQKILSSYAVAEEQSAAEKVEVSKPVISMALCGPFTGISTDQKIDDSWFCIGSTDGLYVVDLATSELQAVLYFKDNLDLTITMAGSWSFSSGCDNHMAVLVSSLFTPCVVLLEICQSDLQRVKDDAEGFSVFPSSAPLPASPLNAELKVREPNHPKKKGSKEKSLVFHSKVKSSGYTSAPRRIMFSPKTNAEKASSSKKTTKNIGLLHSSYPADSAAPTIPCIDLSIANKQVCCLQYSGDGKQILCGLGDSSVLLYKSSLTASPTVYIGHDKPVSSVSWSLSRQWWLSASEDPSVRIWTNDNSEPAIIMGDNIFSKPVKGAQFYYLDKFLLLASGPSVYLYLYNVDTSRDDIKRYKQRSVIKLASCVRTSSSTDITALSAANDFLSYIILVCGSDHSIQVLDMNKGTAASVLSDAHSRTIHCIAQNKGSIFSTQTSESYNLFLTSAVTDGVKIWDLRTTRFFPDLEFPVRLPALSVALQFSHIRLLNFITEVHAAIKMQPDLIKAYVYDIRSSTYLHKLQRHSDTVLSVAFNPATPELLTGTLDGKLRLFQSGTGSHLSRDTTAALHCFPNMTA